MKRLYVWGLTAAVILALSGCTVDGPSGADGQDFQLDTVYTEPNAMAICLTNPKRALLMIDSAVTVYNITPQRGEYLKAITYNSGLKDHSRARQICLDLLASDAVKSDTVQQERIYRLLVGIERSSGNYAEVVRYATEGSRLAHVMGEPQEVGYMAGYIALAKANMGQVEEAVDLLRTTLADLGSMDSYHAVNSHHSVGMDLLHVLLDACRYDEMLPVCDQLMAREQTFRDYPERFTLPEDFDPTEFNDIVRGQTCAFYCAANALLGRVAEVHRWEAEIEKTQWSHTIDCDRMMATTYQALHDWPRFNAANDRMEATYRDTLVTNYLVFLTDKSLGLKQQGRTAEALDLMERAMVIKDTLYNRNIQAQIAQLTAQYHLQEEQMARLKAETDARIFKLLVIGLIVGILAAIAFAFYFFYKKQEISRKNKVLVRLIDEQNNLLLETSPMAEERTDHEDDSDKSDESSSRSGVRENDEGKALFLQFSSLIHDKHLYRDAMVDREMVCQQLGITRRTLNQLLNDFADGLSLPAYINKVRLGMACKLLREEPAKSISDIAGSVGMNQRNFRTQFKNLYGISPTEYRQNQ